MESINQQNIASLALFWPESILILGILGIFILDLVVRRSAQRGNILTAATLGVLAASALATSMVPTTTQPMFFGMLASDRLALFFKWLFLGATAICVLIAAQSREIDRVRLGEYYALLLCITLGMNMMASSTDLLMVYLSLELVSIVSYILAGFRKHDRRSSEGALKYVIYGGVSSGIMLFGMSFLYGLFGTTSVPQIAHHLGQFTQEIFIQTNFGQSETAGELTLIVAMVFVLAGVGYKIASVPWHMWCPDVYEGAPTPFTAFLSVGPKAAGFAVAIRMFYGALTVQSTRGIVHMTTDLPWPAVLGIIAAFTMTLGNFSAITQTNLKRMLAYSSIAHAGYILMGLAAFSQDGNLSVLLYLAFYVFMNLGAFLVVGAVASISGSESIAEYKGLIRRAPFAAIAFAVFLFSLTGIPPMAGFIGKYYLFAALVSQALTNTSGSGWFAVLAVVGALNSAVSLYYYARVVKAMFLDKPTETSAITLPWSYQALLGFLMFFTVGLGIYWRPVSEFATLSLTMIRG